jgi:CheY-like chemotaxis protein
MPYAAPAVGHKPPEPSPQVSREPKRMRILMVDDHVDTNRALQRILSKMGYQVRTAGSVASALKAAEEPFDLLISDIGLPDGSGIDLLRMLRDRQPVKAIALSGFGMEDDIRRSREAGFSEHLVKPINLQKLEEAIQHVAAE